ncbi:MAG: enoyl-CoA hydratase/isomerase family protein [Myxococcota bacterium]
MTLESLEFIQVNVAQGVADLTINRPRARALNKQLLEELGKALEALAGQDSLRCVIVTGAGKAFVAGADISQMGDLGANEANFPLRATAFLSTSNRCRCRF